MSVERQHVHSLVDKLGPNQLSAVLSLLTVMLDPVSRPLPDTLIDDEPETEQEREAVAEADEWLKHNEPIPFEEILSDFGLTIEDVKGHSAPK